MARVTILGDKAKVLPAELGGSPDAILLAWFEWAKGQRNVEAFSTHDTSGLIINSEDSTMDALNYALSQGFTVEGAPVFIKMTTAKYNSNVPADISNRSYVDNTGATVIRKWSEWHDATHEHMDAADGDKIVAGNSWGVELTSAELTKLLSLTGYTLMLSHEVKQYLPEVEMP